MFIELSVASYGFTNKKEFHSPNTDLMIQNFKAWYATLSIINQLIVSYILMVAFWFTSSLSWDLLVWKTDRPIEYFVFGAFFMGFFYTLFFKWRMIKEAITGKQNPHD